MLQTTTAIFTFIMPVLYNFCIISLKQTGLKETKQL